MLLEVVTVSHFLISMLVCFGFSAPGELAQVSSAWKCWGFNVPQEQLSNSERWNSRDKYPWLLHLSAGAILKYVPYGSS